MAFTDISKVMYPNEDGKYRVKIDYKDKIHRYYARIRVDFNLPEEDKKAWGKVIYPKGTTTLLGDTLEHNGLMQWPKGVALTDLFGFYDFTNEKNVKLTGFSKGKGSIMHWDGDNVSLKKITKDELLPLVLNASKIWSQKQKKGADIGSVVHDAIEHFIKDQPFDIGENYMWNIKEAEYPTEADETRALEEFEGDVAMATKAFLEFQRWWLMEKPELLGAEDLIYSMKHNISGTFDGLIQLNGKVILCDWKTSNVSKSKAAAMPEGINYSYFIQSAIYAMAWMEMGNEAIDDLMIVSCRKDGGFTTIMASELGFSVNDCIDWAESVINCYKFMDKTKKGLMLHAEPKEEK